MALQRIARGLPDHCRLVLLVHASLQVCHQLADVLQFVHTNPPSALAKCLGLLHAQELAMTGGFTALQC